MRAPVLYRVGADLVGLLVVARLVLDGAQRVFRALDLIRVASVQPILRCESRLFEVSFLHQGPGKLCFELRRVQLVVPVHVAELLVVVLEVPVRPRQRDQDPRMPSPGLTGRRLYPFSRLEKIEGASLVKKRLGEICFTVVLRHAENEMRNVRARVR